MTHLKILGKRQLTKALTSLVAQTVESAFNTGDSGSILGSGRSPVEGNGNPLIVAWRIPQSSLAGYSPGGCKESDT